MENKVENQQNSEQLDIPVVRHSTPISDKANVSIDSKGNEDLGTWIYRLGLLLDKKIPLKGLTNAQRIEIAVREYCSLKNEKINTKSLCDCQDFENGFVSMSCPIHNTFPAKD